MIEGLLKASRGLEPADLVLKSGSVVNVFTGEIEVADLAVKDGLIVGLGAYEGHEVVDVKGLFLMPGLIDAHIHVESTMLQPSELARILLPRGTTALVADPHEIANVLGLKGIDYLLRASENLPLDFYFMAPSCVPATHLETSGAELTANDLAPLASEPRVLGLAEVMNFPGVINGYPDVMDKIRLFESKVKDGHAPLLSGPDLCAYALAGVSTDHECMNIDEANEKISRGMHVLIREGSGARNLKDLVGAVTGFNFRRMAFCTDDRHPEDILVRGHMDNILRQSVELGLNPSRAIAMCTLNPSEIYGLNRKGALAPGYEADIIAVDNLSSFNPMQVYKKGVLTAREGEFIGAMAPQPAPDWVVSMNVGPLDEDRLKIGNPGPKARVIGVMEGQLTTKNLVVDTPVKDGCLTADPDRDIARLVVVERHKGSGNIGQGLIHGFGLKKGAMASSVAHDSHNIIAVGMSEAEILLALETIKSMGGGMVVVCENNVLARLPLPLAGLMSFEPAEKVAEDHKKLEAAAQELGGRLKSPFMTLAFMALPVIPSLKLTDMGLFDVDKFEFTPLFLD